MIADRLRAAILQAAISGKLTDQRPEDGTATELLEQIKAERAALVKAKKLKKQKPLPAVSADEQAFVLPASWAWISFGETISLLSGRDLRPEQYSDRPDGIPYITGASNFANGSLIVNRWTAQPLTVARQGDLLITCKGTIGDLAVLEEPEAHIARQVMAITCLQVRRDYIAAFLQYSVAALKAQAKSMIPGISRDMLLFTPFPLPPLAEQERIVAKLDEVLPLIDQLAELEREREYLDREFAKAIERAILQAAISGKLTKQHPEDGTATELLEQIKAERAALVKAKKLQKQKALQPVTEESQPFVIPASWEWVRFQDVNQFRIGKTPKRAEPKFWSPSEVPWVSISDMTQGGSIASTKEGVSAAAIAECFGGQTSPAGTLIMSFKLTIGRCSFLGRDAVHNEAIVSIFPAMSAGESFSTYLSHALPLLSQLGDSKAAIKGNTLNSESIANLPIPLPPPMEQERIAAKLDRALPLARGLGELVS